MYFKEITPKNFIKSLENNGIAVIKNFLSKSFIDQIKKKVPKFLNKPRFIKTPSNVAAIKQNNIKNNNLYWLPKKYHKSYVGNQYKQPTGEIKQKLKKNILKSGYKTYSKYTNSVEFKDPLINFPEIQKIVFEEKLLDTAKKFLKSEPYLGYVAIRCHFKNNLPNIDFNLFHTDGRNKITKKENKLVKVLVPFHLKNKEKIEFNIIGLRRNKIKNKDYYKYQYSKKSELPAYLKKKIIIPKVHSQDILFFDPDNFLHKAKKPNKLRIMLYIVYIKKNNYMIPKTRKIKIKKKHFSQLPNKQKKFAKFLCQIR